MGTVTPSAPLADACPECHPGDASAAYPRAVYQAAEGCLSVAYQCESCGHAWRTIWQLGDAWPIRRAELAGDLTPADYKHLAEEAVRLLCTLGYLGLDRSKQREVWQFALDLDRQLHPWRPRSVVWTPEEGNVEPPRTEKAS